MKKTERKLRSCGFTMIELLVVIGIIMLLIGVLVPGMQMIKKQARNLRQKAVFHGIEIGIGFFRNDDGEYPPSKPKVDGGKFVSGAQHLAEAMVGRDKQGFEPSTKWCAPTDQAAGTGDPTLYDQSDEVSLNRRRDVYLELKDASLHLLSDLYDSTGNCYSGTLADKPAPVLVDVFQHKQIDVDGEKVKVGSPILYYKANRKSKSFRVDPATVPHSRWMYNYQDNDMIARLGTVNDPTVQHKFASDYTAPAPDERTGDEIFYDFITNPRQVTTAGGTTFYKPYNASEYILISAGWDGIFGTKDDLTNFNY